MKLMIGMSKAGLLLIIMLFTAPLKGQDIYAEAAHDFPDQIFEITKVMVHDVISPPAAARYYAYSILAAHLGIALPEQDFTLFNKLNKFPPLKIEAPNSVILSFASTYAMLEVAKKLLPSGNRLEKIQKTLIEDYTIKDKLKKTQIKKSIHYAKLVADHVIAYSKTDGYHELSAKVAYTPKNTEGYWYPTPPAYMEAIEPHWTSIRTFILDSSTQFIPLPPVPFSMDTASEFYQDQLMGVYEAVKTNTQEQEEIAKFWDCNPFEVKVMGHAHMGMKKITPGGHWIGITGIASRKAGLSYKESVEAHALVALTLHDAFVSCWDEKYRSERIRPETVINRHIDRSWRPVLQTPPFPEYTSGHSVASGAAAVVLTEIFGEDFSFVDNTEVPFGLPERHFSSFIEAAEEAAISRYYGGIHYLDACEIGLEQGLEVGTHIIKIQDSHILPDKIEK